MAKELILNLPHADDLFTTQEERDDAKLERVVNLPLSDITDFPNHPFKVQMDAEMLDIVESIKQHGVLVPGLVRLKEIGGYEMVAGHRRKMASELAGRGTMPCIVRILTDDEATIIMVDSNLQRERILLSEKAFAYKMKLEAMKRQVGRPSNNYVPVGHNYEGRPSREILADNSSDSNTQIQRYIRLTNLIPQLLDMVDNAVIHDKDIPQIAMRPAVELSYLSPEQQQTLLEEMESFENTPSHEQAIKMRKFSDEGRLNGDVIHSIMQEEKPNQVEQFKMPKDRISKYFAPGTPAEKIQDTIIMALEYYRQKEQQRERHRNEAR